MKHVNESCSKGTIFWGFFSVVHKYMSTHPGSTVRILVKNKKTQSGSLHKYARAWMVAQWEKKTWMPKPKKILLLLLSSYETLKKLTAQVIL